jgi:SAM-dependent methyltransferase
MADMGDEKASRADDVDSFWESRAQDPALDDSQVTHPDNWQRWLEIELIERYLRAGERVLDVGCGAGYATRHFAPHVGEILGIDASAGMVARAEAAGQPPAPANLSFACANVLELEPATFGTFDLAISVRCLINLPDWPAQQQALRRIASLVRPGGRLILVEGSQSGRDALNRLREGVGLERMPRVWHNRDFEPARLLPFLGELFEPVEQRDLGVYDMISRVVHPLLVAPESPRYDASINQVAARVSLEAPGLPELSRVLFLVLRRR